MAAVVEVCGRSATTAWLRRPIVCACYISPLPDVQIRPFPLRSASSVVANIADTSTLSVICRLGFLPAQSKKIWAMSIDISGR